MKNYRRKYWYYTKDQLKELTFIKCIDDKGSCGLLIKNKIYAVTKLLDTIGSKAYVNDEWHSSRFELVSGVTRLLILGHKIKVQPWYNSDRKDRLEYYRLPNGKIQPRKVKDENRDKSQS